MSDNIIELKEKLDILIQENAPYEDIYNVSCTIDKLLVDYYKEQDLTEDLILRK